MSHPHVLGFWHGLGSCAELPPWEQEDSSGLECLDFPVPPAGSCSSPCTEDWMLGFGGSWDALGLSLLSQHAQEGGMCVVGTLPALLAWHCSQFGKLSGLILGCLAERAQQSTPGTAVAVPG